MALQMWWDESFIFNKATIEPLYICIIVLALSGVTIMLIIFPTSHICARERPDREHVRVVTASPALMGHQTSLLPPSLRSPALCEEPCSQSAQQPSQLNNTVRPQRGNKYKTTTAIDSSIHFYNSFLLIFPEIKSQAQCQHRPWKTSKCSK